VIKNLMSTLPATAMPSTRFDDGPWSGKSPVTPVAARKRSALTGTHAVCAAQHTIQVSEEQSVLQAVSANKYVGNGITFGTPVQAQLSVDALRVHGRAGSPPRGTPV